MHVTCQFMLQTHCGFIAYFPHWLQLRSPNPQLHFIIADFSANTLQNLQLWIFNTLLLFFLHFIYAHLKNSSKKSEQKNCMIQLGFTCGIIVDFLAWEISSFAILHESMPSQTLGRSDFEKTCRQTPLRWQGKLQTNDILFVCKPSDAREETSYGASDRLCIVCTQSKRFLIQITAKLWPWWRQSSAPSSDASQVPETGNDPTTKTIYRFDLEEQSADATKRAARTRARTHAHHGRKKKDVHKICRYRCRYHPSVWQA